MRLRFFLRAILLVAATALAPSHGRAEEPALSARTLVILAGIPGDAATEQTYLDHVQGFLELAAKQTDRPRKIIVFADHPESIRPPAGLPAEARASTREKFLALADEVRAAEGSLLVAAWGHGGYQGATPVFHVRGPRITPDDFKALRKAAGDRPARWILLFRGSGAFARAVQGQNSIAFASENQMAFNDDPVSVPLLLKVARADPSLTFDALAERAAKETDRWYVERSLARTEEPTIWSGGEETRVLLAKNEPVEESKPATEGGYVPFAEEPPPPETAKPDAPEKSAPRTGNPNDWKGIAAVEAAAYPNEEAVALRRVLRFTIGEKPALTEEVDEFIQILTEPGTRRANLELEFHPGSQELTLLDCEVRAPDGKITRVDPDDAHEATTPTLGDYPAPRIKLLNFPGVRPGSIVRMHYRREWARYPLPHMTWEIPLAPQVSARSVEVSIRANKNLPLHYAFQQTASVEPSIEETPYGKVRTWKLGPLSAETGEMLRAPNLSPSLRVSTFPDWSAFSQWYLRLIREADQPTPEIEAKAKELAASAKTDREKIQAIYDYVTTLRYVSVPIGVNSHRPHSAANVFRNQFGDCKDKANLFNVMVRSLGIAADLVLVPRFGQAQADLPGLAFNHAISRVRLGKDSLWIDTTDEVCRFGLLPPGDPGRNVLVVDAKTAALTALPRPEPKDHRLVSKMTLDCSAGLKQPAACEWEAHAEGYCDYGLRFAARNELAQRGFPLLLARYSASPGAFEMASQQNTPPADLQKAFVWKSSGRWHGYASTGGRGDSLLRAPFFLPAEWSAALHARRSPLYLNDGYPLRLEQEVEFKLPNAKELTLPKASASTTGPLRWNLEWTRPAPDRAVARFVVEVPEAELNADQTRAFQDQLRALHLSVAEAGAAVLSP